MATRDDKAPGVAALNAVVSRKPADMGTSALFRRLRGRMAGGLFTSGSVLALLVLALQPDWIDGGATLVVILSIAAVSGITMFLCAESMTTVVALMVSSAGAVLIAVAQLLLRHDTANFAAGLLYVWVAVYSGLFFRRRIIVGHLTLIAGCQAIVLPMAQVPLWLPQLIMTTGTCAVAAFVVAFPVLHMRRDLYTDTLTGVVNRRGLEDTIGRVFDETFLSGRLLAIALVDLDGFKAYNDANGHGAGDEVLVNSVRAWAACLRRGDLLVRIGGDEFLVVLPSCDLVDGQKILARVVESTPPQVTCSVGLAVTDGNEPYGDVVSRADAAMYRAKSGGGAQVALDGI